MKPVEGNVVIGPETASLWRRQHHYQGQRGFRPWHASNLAKEMSLGRFRPKTQISFAEFNGDLFCTNGQHTLAAIEQSGTQQLVSVVINKCASLQEVADDFARHDTHLTRKFSDSMVAHDVHTRLGVTPTTLNIITAASIYYAQLRGELWARAQMLTHDMKMEIVDRYGALARDSLQLFDGAMALSYLTRKTTVASLMVTYSAQPELASEFWRPLALDDGLRVNDARKTLLSWLRDRVTTGGGYQAKRTKVAADHEFVKGIAIGWNAWVTGRELKLIRVDFDAHLATFAKVGSVKVRHETKQKS